MNTEQEFKQFEKEGFEIVMESEEIGGETKEAAVAHYKGARLGVISVEPQPHPDRQVEKSDAQRLAEFGGLAYFKKEFAQEIEQARVPAALRDQINDFCTSKPSASSQQEQDRED